MKTIRVSKQRTLRRPFALSGHGVHSARPATVRVLPAACGHGIRFVRVDLESGQNTIDARYDAVSDTMLCTCLSNEHGATVGTVEHLLAALSGCGVDNALIEIDGPEVPIMDGSSYAAVAAIAEVGLIDQAEPLGAIRILKDVEVDLGDKRAALRPAERFEVSFEIQFDAEAIGHQRRTEVMSGGAFQARYARARTFAQFAEVEKLRAAGLGLGGSLHNAVIVDDARVLNNGGLRYSDEFVRHKMLDVVGDLALAGSPIIGRYDGFKAGHDMTNRVLRALFADPTAWRHETIVDRGALLPDMMAVGVERACA